MVTRGPGWNTDFGKQRTSTSLSNFSIPPMLLAGRPHFCNKALRHWPPHIWPREFKRAQTQSCRGRRHTGVKFSHSYCPDLGPADSPGLLNYKSWFCCSSLIWCHSVVENLSRVQGSNYLGLKWALPINKTPMDNQACPTFWHCTRVHA